MKKIAVFPGSFNPITMGHYDIVKRTLHLFDQIIVAVGTNESKTYQFSKHERLEMAKNAFKDLKTVTVTEFKGLTVDFCKANDARFILRGLRNGIDFEYEKSIANMNKDIYEGIETIYINSSPAFEAISSSIVRELIKNNADVSKYLPKGVKIK